MIFYYVAGLYFYCEASVVSLTCTVCSLFSIFDLTFNPSRSVGTGSPKARDHLVKI